jgi:predicted nucleic acid-binding protein
MIKKKRRIYLDTSVIGGCFDTWSNALFKDFENSVYQPVLSEIVAHEIKSAPKRVINKFLELSNYDAEYVHITNIVMELTELYIDRKILTEKHYNDASHIALATVYEVDILASWNFRHIVRFDKVQLFNTVNLEQGYKMISIYSPNLITTTLIA